jgi:hypothetical protein
MFDTRAMTAPDIPAAPLAGRSTALINLRVAGELFDAIALAACAAALRSQNTPARPLWRPWMRTMPGREPPAARAVW